MIWIESAQIQVRSSSPLASFLPGHINLVSTAEIRPPYKLKAVKDWIWVFKIFAKSQSMIYFNLERNWKVLILPKINSHHYLVSFGFGVTKNFQNRARITLNQFHFKWLNIKEFDAAFHISITLSSNHLNWNLSLSDESILRLIIFRSYSNVITS